MAVITEIIPAQGFEIVQNRIGEILIEEISNQIDLQNLSDSVEVFVERIEPFDKSEDVMISVAFKEGEYEGQTTSDSQGYYTYFIDLFVTGKGIGNESPSTNARNKLFKYIGMIRYILMSGKLQTLGFVPGLIGGKTIKKIMLDTDYSNFGNHSNYDGAFIRFCRIYFTVRVQESQLLFEGIPLQGNNTNITYETTNKGTKVIFNN
jgi:hypothetical protein